jgi:hypothetical protein
VVTSGVLTLAAPANLTQYPVVASQGYAAQARVRGGSTDPIVTIGIALVWLDSAGSTISTTTGSTAATSAGAWTQITATGTAPATAVYVRMELRVTAASVSGAAFVYVDALGLHLSATVPDWSLGTGIPLVVITEMADTYRILPRHDGAWTLTEVG